MKSLTHYNAPRKLSGALIMLLVSWFALSSMARAVLPAPDGGYPGGNTAEGQQALLSLTTGTYNTAVGFLSLRSNTSGNFNTAAGAGTLLANTGYQNTAVGAGALLSNTTGFGNTAEGAFALFSNTEGGDNTAVGTNALFSNTTGEGNTAIGFFALLGNTTGGDNTAMGGSALSSNTTGNDNTAIGVGALDMNSTGSSNIAVGNFAGASLTTGNNNIDIGHAGFAGESDTIRIGAGQTRAFLAGISGTAIAGTGVVVTASGQLGVSPSSERFKENIKPMDNASEALYSLKPVAFRYKKEIDPAGISQFGLVAEEVEKVNPDLVVRDNDEKPYSVRYDQINAMLLNEFLKAHRKMEDQQKQIDTLTAQLKHQAALIHKVNAQVGLNRPSPQMALSNQ
jgi:trimeric autotransporter adhesin